MKQFCDCYDHDFRLAVNNLAKIVDTQTTNDSIRATASMYIKTAHEIDIQRYIRSLEEQLRIMREQRDEDKKSLKEYAHCMDCKTPFGSLCEKCADKE